MNIFLTFSLRQTFSHIKALSVQNLKNLQPKIEPARLKTELEEDGRKLRLMWHFGNDGRSFAADRFRPKSSFNPRNKDVIIETYRRCLEVDIEIPSKRFNNFRKEEWEAFYSLKDDPSFIIKGADKGSVVVACDRDDYLKEAYRQLDDKEESEQVTGVPSVLANALIEALENIRLRGDLSKCTLDYFLVKDPKFARFYLLPKIHKRLHDVPGKRVISSCGYYTEKIFSFLDYHSQPLAQKVKLYIKDTNHFLSKLESLRKLLQGAILCTIDVVCLYPNIPHVKV